MPTKPIIELISHIHLSNKRFAEQQTIKVGLTIKQYFLLKQLEKYNLTPAKVALMLYADRPTVSVIINNLKKKGYITVKHNPKDKRSTILMISDKGNAKLAKFNHLKHKKIQPLSSLNNIEKETLRTLLEKVSNSINNQIQNNNE